MELGVLGEQSFTLGFKLAGIRHVIDVMGDADEKVKAMLSEKELGVVLIDDHTMNNISERTKEEVVNSLKPVFVTVSGKSAQEELRQMIIKSIGVDLLKD